jgi:hypothetical protein
LSPVTIGFPEFIACTVLLYVVMALVESHWWNILLSVLARGARGGLHLLRRAIDPQVVGRRVRTAVGTAGVLACLFLLINGVGGASTRNGSTSLSNQLFVKSLQAVDRLPGQFGDRARFLVNDMAIHHTNSAPMPAFLNAVDADKLAAIIGKKGDKIDVGDSGAAIHVRTSINGAIEGSARPNDIKVHTANGSVTPPVKADFLQVLACDDGTKQSVILRDVLIMEECAHNLISLGKLARDEHIGFTLGAGDDPTFLSLPNGTKAPLLNLGIVVVPPPDASMANLIARGTRTTKHVDGRIVHSRGVHASHTILRNWHRCTADVPEEWAKAVQSAPCDSCLRAKAPAIPSDKHVPNVTEPGDCVSFDVYSLGLKHVHGGQSKVWGAHDHKSKLNYVTLLRDESEDEIGRALREFHTYCRSKKVVIRRLHTDNYASYHSPKVVAIVRDEIKCRYTRSPPNTPRANGDMERQWRTMGGDTRSMLNESNLPRNYAWYALKQSVDVRNTLPFGDSPDQCPLSIFCGGIKPNASQFRAWGCVAYAKVFDRVTKMADQAVRCVHLGRNDSGYLCYDPAAKRMHVSAHCSFVESAMPGLWRDADNIEHIIPEFADNFEQANTPSNSTSTPLEPARPILDDNETIPALVRPDDELTDEEDEPLWESLWSIRRDAPTPQTARATATRTRAAARASRAPPTMAQQRPLRASANYGPQAAARNLSLAAKGLQPGGEAIGTQILGLDAKARGRYIIYLCSGETREGDFAEWVRKLSAAEVYVINIDTQQGGYAHDLADPTVSKKLVALAQSSDCAGVLATIPCSTFSSIRFVQPGPKPVRNLTHPEGIPHDQTGRIPAIAATANRIAEHAIAVAEAAIAHGGACVFESPVGRGAGSSFAIDGREEHASLWDLPAMIEFANRHGNLSVTFDQCRTGAATQKTTKLLCSPSIFTAVRERLGPLVCNHTNGTHPSLVNENASDGEYKTKAAEKFTSELNRHLAESFLAPRRTTSSDNGTQWFQQVGVAITSHTNRVIDSFSYVVSEAKTRLRTRGQSPASLIAGTIKLYLELNDHDRVAAAAILHDIAPIATAHGLCHLLEDVDVNALAVSIANRHSPDFPSYNAAMKGPEAAKWDDAMGDEVGSLRRLQVFEEVPEDSCPTWDVAKGRATEVVDMLWVLKKKYNEMRELVKFKARATIRGDQETAVDKQLGLSPEETFAPTMRHNTLKLLTGAAVARAAQRTSSQGGAGGGHPLRFRSADVPVAFLNGASLSGRPRYVRPPPGFRTHDRRGVPIVWLMMGNCYGRTIAPRVWNTTLHTFLVQPTSQGGMGLTQSDNDPCYYYKVYADGTRLDAGIYVDDAWLVDDAGPLADADIDRLISRFNIKVVDDPKHFLGMNVSVESITRVKFSSEAYILSMADKYVPGWRDRPKVTLPSTDKLTKAYEAAHARETPVDPRLGKSYQSKVGGLIYTSPCVRVDTCYTISRLARALTFPNAELDSCADDVIVYLAQTATDGVIFDGHAPDAAVMKCASDSDWAIGHSTTGWVILLAGAAVAYSSKRQGCIAVSSTEAEIVAASACSLEIIHFRRLLVEMGLPQSVTPLYVDNSGAVELSRDRKSCHRSRHIDRRYFKVRELVASGEIVVERVPTEDNPADLLTKSLPTDAYTRHRDRVFGWKPWTGPSTPATN